MDEIFGGKSKKEPEFYQALGCDRSSSIEQITAEYRARVKYLHPDKLDEADPKKHEEYLQLQVTFNFPNYLAFCEQCTWLYKLSD
ncbi:unnamed protein product [Haemonchus placei]|uniref:J domain-containing protein n=1 Tax=Haemonchus placei TaxID=6290 RepID=A0A0N4WAC6_HAEPC|nr:unnamed protein product [Haemonchus placei]